MVISFDVDTHTSLGFLLFSLSLCDFQLKSMSRVNASKMAAGAPAGLIGELHPPAAPTETAPAVETAAVFPEMNPSEMGEIHSRQIVVDTELSATQLSLGHEVKLTQNLASVFAEGVANVSFKNKAIVTGIDLCNVYSSVPKRVSVGINLFSNAEQKQGLRNETGWLYSSGSSDFAVQDHVGFAGDDGSFTNLASLLPMEQARHAPATQLYNPCNSELTSRQLSDYGNITSEKQLWEGIVPVTDDLYYVPAESVVCKVVSKNWVSSY